MIQVSIVSRGSHYAAISCAHNHWATCGTAQSGFTFHCLCQNIEQNRKRCVFFVELRGLPRDIIYRPKTMHTFSLKMIKTKTVDLLTYLVFCPFW